MTILSIANAIKMFEGWLDPIEHPPNGSRSWRNNNPGNIRFTGFRAGVKEYDSAGFNVYETYEEGWQDLISLLNHRKQQHPEWTIMDLFMSYAPPVENDTTLYARFVARFIGATTQTKLSELT
jgi:hypothetical protein